MKYGPFDKAEVYQTDYHENPSAVLREMADWFSSEEDDPVLLCINISMSDDARYFGTLVVERA